VTDGAPEERARSGDDGDAVHPAQDAAPQTSEDGGPSREDGGPSREDGGPSREDDDPSREDGDQAPASPRDELLARLGGTDDPAALIDAYLIAREYFERGDNRRAAAELRALLAREPSAELRASARELLGRIRPDRVAVLVLAVCVLALVVIWLLAVRAH
jgi:hypothetical protein